MSLDLWLFELINGFAGRTPVLDQIMQALVSDYVGPTLQVLGLLGLWFEGRDPADRRESQRTVFRSVVAVLVSGALVGFSNMLYFRDRPFRYHEVNMLFYYPTDSSFPSNSATVVFSIAITVWLYNRRWGWPMMLFAAAFAFSRVYGGAHYPADIIAGFLLGSGTAWALTRYSGWLNRLVDPVISLARRVFLA